MDENEAKREALYAAVEPHMTPDLRYTPDVDEAEVGFAVWDTESGQQVQQAESLDEAIRLSSEMNTKLSQDH